jgi:hypothetical protein
MPLFLLIGLAAGLGSAFLFAAAIGGGSSRILIYLLTPLPVFIAGFGWGTIAAAISGVISTLAVAVVVGPKAGCVLLLSQAIPAVALVYLAGLARPVAVPAPAPSGSMEPQVEWYPVGRLVAATTLMSGVVAFATIFLLGQDLDTLRGVLRELIETVFLKQLPGFSDRPLTEGELSSLVEIALYALPAGSALTWGLGTLSNLWLGARISRAAGWLRRPWPDIAEMRYPAGFGLAFAIAIAIVSLVSGYPALLASGFAGAFFCAYTLMGLAIVHHATRGRPSRPIVLTAVYTGLFVLNTWGAIVLVLLALLEPFLPFRRVRPAAPRTGPS